MTDSELVRKAQERNTEAWRILVERYLPLVWRYAYALVQDVHLTEDLVGETMLAFVKEMDRIESETPQLSAWLRGVVRHKVADHYRGRFRQRDQQTKLEEDFRPADSQTSPTQPIETAETRDQVLEILDQLPERQRMALEWKYVEGLRVREIAQRLGETEKGVEATLYRARRDFRHRFELAESSASTPLSSRATLSSRDSPSLEADLPQK